MKMDDFGGFPLFLEIPTSSFRVHVPASELLVEKSECSFSLDHGPNCRGTNKET